MESHIWVGGEKFRCASEGLKDSSSKFSWKESSNQALLNQPEDEREDSLTFYHCFLTSINSN